MKYALEAMQQCEMLYVGLTRVLTEVGDGEEVAPHRSKMDSNPFFYRERVKIIRSALSAAGIPEGRFSVGPFPIENPSRLPEFWSTKDTCFTTVVDNWNRMKIELIERAGFKVTSIKEGPWTGSDYASGTTIRALIRARDTAWHKFVPDGARQEIEEILKERDI
ncbi:MAG: hypothetical protein KDA56_06380 [Hyphomonas sp.]|nr:hypothetical protein [Hyphomonas sp.]